MSFSYNIINEVQLQSKFSNRIENSSELNYLILINLWYRYQSNENQNDNPNFMNNKSVASSDLSLHMHTLAMKYISNGQQSDEKEQSSYYLAGFL